MKLTLPIRDSYGHWDYHRSRCQRNGQLRPSLDCKAACGFLVAVRCKRVVIGFLSHGHAGGKATSKAIKRYDAIDNSAVFIILTDRQDRVLKLALSIGDSYGHWNYHRGRGKGDLKPRPGLDCKDACGFLVAVRRKCIVVGILLHRGGCKGSSKAIKHNGAFYYGPVLIVLTDRQYRVLKFTRPIGSVNPYRNQNRFCYENDANRGFFSPCKRSCCFLVAVCHKRVNILFFLHRGNRSENDRKTIYRNASLNDFSTLSLYIEIRVCQTRFSIWQ